MILMTLGCRTCGGFVQHLDIICAMAWLDEHPLSFLCTDAEYYRRLAETLPAEQETAS
ncbi:MAG TPA: hypothetical protein VHT75_04180 [Acidimicrobiales bacterium]|jgi:hypothetical protein|nr:hypothetical protein [Acidimicrobiales bacterium]